MNRIIFLLFIFLLSGCTVQKNYYVNSQLLKLPKDELSLLATIEYIQQDNPDCTGDCKINVASTFEYLDKCLMYQESSNIDFNERMILSPNVYYLKSFGRVIFSRSAENSDYYFSPIIIDEKSKSIAMQVKKKNKKRYYVIYNILNNKLYLGSDGEYPIDCIW